MFVVGAKHLLRLHLNAAYILDSKCFALRVTANKVAEVLI